MRFALVLAAVCLFVAVPSAVRSVAGGRGIVSAYQSAADRDDTGAGRDGNDRGLLSRLFFPAVLAFKKTILVAIVLLAALIRRVVRRRSKVVPPPLPPLPPRS